MSSETKRHIKTFNLETPLVKMAGIALIGQCDLVSIMVPRFHNDISDSILALQ